MDIKRIEFPKEEQLTLNGDGTTTVRLRYPLTDSDEKIIERVTIRRPKVRHMRALDPIKGDVARELRLFEEVSGISERVLAELDIEDFTTIGEVVKGYMGKSQGTGPTS